MSNVETQNTLIFAAASAAVMPASYQPMGIMLNVPGGFVTLGLLLILVNAIKKLAAKKSAARKEGLA